MTTSMWVKDYQICASDEHDLMKCPEGVDVSVDMSALPSRLVAAVC